jgi:formylglycine-generating enzyme required for sulfatase activity
LARKAEALQRECAAHQGPCLIQFSTKRGWLVQDKNSLLSKALQIKTEAISVPGYVEELADGVAIKMVRIMGGEFEMGSPLGEKERFQSEDPQHSVTLESFFLGQMPVTQAQWKVVAGWPKLRVALNPTRSHFNGANRPVEQVTWEEAMEFCQRLSKRSQRTYTLPSEAHWEYACRAGSTTPFAFGETLTPELANYDGNYTYGTGPKGAYRKETTDVGRFPANAWGLHDMHGNVWEWCLDHWEGTYQGAPSDGRAWLSAGAEQRRLLRGGSWYAPPRNCRSASRYRRPPSPRNASIGFRLCVSPPGLPS